jgi:hypothetical protein
MTSEEARAALETRFGFEQVKKDINEALGEIPVLAISRDPRVQESIEGRLRRALRTINELAEAGDRTKQASQEPAEATPEEAA